MAQIAEQVVHDIALDKTGELSIKGQRWTLSTADERAAQTISQKYDLPLAFAHLLVDRVKDFDDIPTYLSPTLRQLLPNPYHLKDMQKAVDRIYTAIKQKEKIAVFGDYDVDGATSSALLKRFFQHIGSDLMAYIPDRIQEGYGPSIKGFSELKRQAIEVIITVDCGTMSFEALTYAQQEALDVIVLDHHVSDIKLPPAVALVNPNRFDEESEYGFLAAVGVTFLFLVGLHQKLRQDNFYHENNIESPNLMKWLDIVALGTVCDVVPLVDVNRAFVTQGLKVMQKQENPGLRALCQVASVQQRLSAYHLGFVLGPRINAGGRVGTSSLGTDLLSSEDFFSVQETAKKLDLFNSERKAVEQQVLEEAMALAEKKCIDHAVIVVACKGWHQGVIGIVASRLKERFHRPCFVMALDDEGVGKGSGRSIKGFDMGTAVLASHQAEIIEKGGGHPMAAGVTITQDQLPRFEKFMDDTFGQQMGADFDFTPNIKLSTSLGLATIDDIFMSYLEKLAPYGAANAEPKFLIPQVKLQNTRVVGEKHIRGDLVDFRQNRIQAICFGAVETALEEAFLTSTESLDVIGTLKMNVWNGYAKPQFQILDARYSR